MYWGQFKDPLCYLCNATLPWYCGVETSWCQTQKVAGSNMPFNYDLVITESSKFS